MHVVAGGIKLNNFENEEEPRSLSFRNDFSFNTHINHGFTHNKEMRKTAFVKRV